MDMDFFKAKDTITVAKALLGTLLTYDHLGQQYAGYIVETEAYLGQIDAASHAFRGKRTVRNEALFAPSGAIYIYQMRGLYLLNVITAAKDTPEGVLIRGIEPVINLTQMIENRHGQKGINVTNGPGKLCQAMALHTLSYNGKRFGEVPLDIEVDHRAVPKTVLAASRIGVPNKGEWTEKALRFYVAHNPYVSKLPKKMMDFKTRGWQTDESTNF
ncbi:3-methyladenine DNA glycosylase [Agrilactobacillus composti DSM 18527 = JCM 14202]|uniref:Putative 3-methyladenine DNA glycosylase n=1 Tax=Agrilactobacillus composti DSM 18527 = JCM 14202 TaxID=1423734 RepID=X0PV93_9LACO|nr:DNA-3-methyladenine glycosylase [Agrilactobacillus composti]KRM36877.1 3-methyladenine DNA glycosylase [Agrilactobacillus composti DSM 18527 = JCM 14202]GAF41391.1 DNA-3-methyladenine glycosylase II [Agrilactobacillus composti DSM 18527 = JCM 14202]